MSASVNIQVNDELLAFQYIRNHKWKELLELINKNETLDMNYRDKNGNYLLTYAVKFNRADIVKVILDKNSRCDIVDKLDRSILYEAITFNYDEIVSLLLEYSIKNIGVRITDIRDVDNNIPLHYAIKNDNVDYVRLLIKYDSNPYITDNDGFNALHMAVKKGSIDMTKEIIKIMNNVDGKTKRGEAPLHISLNYKYNDISKLLLEQNADPDIVDNGNGFTPLHYAVGWNNTIMLKLLLDHNANPNKQDIYGNTPLMYSVKEDYAECFNILMGYDVNVNLWNIDGRIILHDVLENYTDDRKNYLDQIIDKSNMIIQNSNGNTCLHYLIMLKLWKIYKNVIETRKLNIFSKNSDGVAVIDLIYNSDPEKKEDYYVFLDMVANSYLHQLKKEKKDWKLELDKICSRNFTDLTENEKSYIKNANEKSFYQNCKTLILEKLEDTIKKYFDGNMEFCQRSYPVDISQCVEIHEGLPLDICTFTGSILDILIGLMFLVKKHKNVCTTLNKNHEPNKDLCDFYKSMGLVMNGRCDFLNFEIVWVEYKLYTIDNFSKLFDACVLSTHRFIIVPLGIEMKNGSHANYLIYDKQTKEIERFEPHGGSTPIGFNYNSQLLDELLEEYFKSIDKNIRYVAPNEYIPIIGFQIMDMHEEKYKRIGDPGGFCALWSIWYVDQRLTYHSYSRDKLIDILFENINIKGISYRNMIRNYSRNIINKRDELLQKVDLDINDWMNDNYTNVQLDKFMGILLNEINNCCSIVNTSN